jgi:selenide, water dikinase
MATSGFDLLSTVDFGGCSAKLGPRKLEEALAGLPAVTDPRVLVDIRTHDDAGIYRLNEETALIQTTDFFPPVCSDPYEFGQIAAANALSDVFAMGGEVLTAMNLVMFPSTRIPLEVLREILRGGAEKVHESGGVIIGGHTIDDYPPKYGLAVTGVVHPDRIITNAAASPGDRLILSKPIGMGILSAGQKLGIAGGEAYRYALQTMKQLNRAGARIMQKFMVKAATDITGFGLLGHALRMAEASGVTLKIKGFEAPILPEAYDLAEKGCLPGAAFRNQEFVEGSCRFRLGFDYSMKMLLQDAQTSGGLLMAVKEACCFEVLKHLQAEGYRHAAIIGEVLPPAGKPLWVE